LYLISVLDKNGAVVVVPPYRVVDGEIIIVGGEGVDRFFTVDIIRWVVAVVEFLFGIKEKGEEGFGRYGCCWA
jgi:hypothetical protein